MPTSLPKDDRNKLASAILKARVAAEDAVKKALQSLAVHEADPRAHMSPELRQFRTFLRLRPDSWEIKTIRTKALTRSNTWLSRLPTSTGTKCYLPASSPRTISFIPRTASPSPWRSATNSPPTKANAMGFPSPCATPPACFRRFSAPKIPLVAWSSTPYDQQQLKGILDSIPASTFHADDSLGWVYQFWQAERKDEVNASGEKIGADELAPVTQLFTEDYMVSFLLDNSLGAWWAGKRLTDEDLRNATSEDELRAKHLSQVSRSNIYASSKKTMSGHPPPEPTRNGLTTSQNSPRLTPAAAPATSLSSPYTCSPPILRRWENLSAQDACDRVLSEASGWS